MNCSLVLESHGIPALLQSSLGSRLIPYESSLRELIRFCSDESSIGGQFSAPHLISSPATSSCPANSGFWTPHHQDVVLTYKTGPVAQVFSFSHAFTPTSTGICQLSRPVQIQSPQSVDAKPNQSGPYRVNCGTSHRHNSPILFLWQPRHTFKKTTSLFSNIFLTRSQPC